jgi:1-aminocyclopropane-1-carboxylate deaminase
MQNLFLYSDKLHSFIRELNIPSKQQTIYLEECHREIIVVRDDLIHSVISGNKWRKLNYHLQHFSAHTYHGISSMGGCFSNHLHALAFTCHQLGIPCTLFIYGWNGEWNSQTLIDCKNWNAELIPITRNSASEFRQSGIEKLQEPHPMYYWIPEGGGGLTGEKGIKELTDELPQGFDTDNNLLVCACGTGTTIQGILNSTSYCKVSTMKIVKMAHYSWELNNRIQWITTAQAHSFAKKDPNLMEFIHAFEEKYDILLDPVYTAPLMRNLIGQTNLDSYQNIYFIHTGGLQANRMN